MKRRIQGLSETTQTSGQGVPAGVFLVRVDRAQLASGKNPSTSFAYPSSSLASSLGGVLSGRVYCAAKALVETRLVPPRIPLRLEEFDEKALPDSALW